MNQTERSTESTASETPGRLESHQHLPVRSRPMRLLVGVVLATVLGALGGAAIHLVTAGP